MFFKLDIEMTEALNTVVQKKGANYFLKVSLPIGLVKNFTLFVDRVLELDSPEEFDQLYTGKEVYKRRMFAIKENGKNGVYFLPENPQELIWSFDEANWKEIRSRVTELDEVGEVTVENNVSSKISGIIITKEEVKREERASIVIPKLQYIHEANFQQTVIQPMKKVDFLEKIPEAEDIQFELEVKNLTLAKPEASFVNGKQAVEHHIYNTNRAKVLIVFLKYPKNRIFGFTILDLNRTYSIQH